MTRPCIVFIVNSVKRVWRKINREKHFASLYSRFFLDVATRSSGRRVIYRLYSQSLNRLLRMRNTYLKDLSLSFTFYSLTDNVRLKHLFEFKQGVHSANVER